MIMPKNVLNVNLVPNQGKYTFDSVTKLLVWDVGKMEIHQGKSLPTVKGNIVLQSGAPIPDSNPNILVKFNISQFAISGLKVNRLDMYGEVCVCVCIDCYFVKCIIENFVFLFPFFSLTEIQTIQRS